MAKRRVSKKYASIRAMVRDLEDLVDGEKWTLDTKACAAWKKRPWAGAGTVICDKPPKTPNPDHTYVVSPYVVELSWLFDYLKILCSEFVDFTNKDAFYGRLGDAANRYLSARSSRFHNPQDLCFAVLREAERIVEEASCGQLSGDRNGVEIKRVWVQLHPGGSDKGAGLAVYFLPPRSSVSLLNQKFIFKGATYRMGEVLEKGPTAKGILHMAVYYDAKSRP